MKKIILYIVILIVMCFALPAIFTKTFKTEETSTNIVDEQENSSSIVQYNYNKFNTIALLHKKTNEIEHINLDEYLYGVVAAEMPVNYEMEALKAQAIVARTYTLYKLINDPNKHGDANICDDYNCCQAWISREDRLARWEESKREENWNRIVEAVNSTAGKVITYNGQPINAFFHSNSGGKTEIPINVWGGSNFPYLQSVETSGEENYDQYASEAEFTKTDIIDRIKIKHSEIAIDFNNNDDIKITEYTDSGRVKTIKFGNVNLSGVEARTIFGLKSTNFQIEVLDNSVRFSVKGYGHGVGLSQTGSDSLAKQGQTCEEIIKHFYQGVEVSSY